ncbi:MAG: DJ-1 family glyoxalase III [Thermodesulfobacteriota bacterium]
MASVLVPLAQGCEELEAVAVIDVLRRAGIEVVTAGLEPAVAPVRGRCGVVLVPDTALDQALDREFDLVVLPGGLAGTNALRADPRIRSLILHQHSQGRLLAAICAAPVVLAEAGVLAGRRATSYPGCLAELGLADILVDESPVVRDGTVITSKGPGTAVELALCLVEALAGSGERQKVAAEIQRP